MGASTAGAKFVVIAVSDLYCQGGYGEEDSLETIIRAINDCHAVSWPRSAAARRAI